MRVGDDGATGPLRAQTERRRNQVGVMDCTAGGDQLLPLRHLSLAALVQHRRHAQANPDRHLPDTLALALFGHRIVAFFRRALAISLAKGVAQFTSPIPGEDRKPPGLRVTVVRRPVGGFEHQLDAIQVNRISGELFERKTSPCANRVDKSKCFSIDHANGLQRNHSGQHNPWISQHIRLRHYTLHTQHIHVHAQDTRSHSTVAAQVRCAPGG